MANMNQLTAKQQRFVEEYLIDFNATQAAIRAGYSENTAYAIGYENLKKPQIAAEIARKTAQKTAEAEITVDYVISRLKIEAERTGKGSSASARVAALTQLGRYLSMFKDNTNVNYQDLEARMREAEERIRMENARKRAEKGEYSPVTEAEKFLGNSYDDGE